MPHDAHGWLPGSGRLGAAFGYAGQYTDAETGFQYLRARYYDPATGNFLTRDPIEAITRSAYGYVGGDPLNFTDPSGLKKGKEGCETGGGSGAKGCKGWLHNLSRGLGAGDYVRAVDSAIHGDFGEAATTVFGEVSVEAATRGSGNRWIRTGKQIAGAAGTLARGFGRVLSSAAKAPVAVPASLVDGMCVLMSSSGTPQWSRPTPPSSIDILSEQNRP